MKEMINRFKLYLLSYYNCNMASSYVLTFDNLKQDFLI